LVMAHTRPGLRSHGLSDQQWRVLRVLGEDHGNGGHTAWRPDALGVRPSSPAPA
jgi:hypothetical protein